MPPSQLAASSPPRSVRYLSMAEREELALLRVQGYGVREIARRLKRSMHVKGVWQTDERHTERHTAPRTKNPA